MNVRKTWTSWSLLSELSELSVAMQSGIDSENPGHYTHHSASESAYRVMDGFLYLAQAIGICQVVD